MPPNSTWKVVERRIATWFSENLGRTIRRQRLSGSSGRDDCSASDSTDPCLYLEVKYRKRPHGARTFFNEIQEPAQNEDKIPVLILVSNNEKGFLACVHSDDLMRFCEHMTSRMQRTMTEPDVNA